MVFFQTLQKQIPIQLLTGLIFRLAGIAQGIVGRVRDGTASSSEAKNYESFVPILGKLGWNIVEEAAK